MVHEKNTGFVQGLINTIAMAKGEYIAIHGSGDIALPTRLEKQVEVLDSRPDVGAVGCWYTNINERTGQRTTVQTTADSFSLDDLARQNPFSHGEVMFRRTEYEKAGGYRPEFRFAQDIDLWMRIRKSARIATVPEFLYERYILSDGVTHNPRKFADQARYSILGRRLARMPEREQLEILALIREDGPAAAIPKDDPELQHRYVRGTINMGRSGSPTAAIASARENIVSPWRRALLILAFRVYGSPARGIIDHMRSILRTVRQSRTPKR